MKEIETLAPDKYLETLITMLSNRKEDKFVVGLIAFAKNQYDSLLHATV